MLVAALAGRYSRVLPLLSRRFRSSVVAHAPLLLVAPMAPVLVPVTLVGVVTVLLARIPPIVSGVQSGRARVAGRVVLAAALLFALPRFVSSAADIIGRGP